MQNNLTIPSQIGAQLRQVFFGGNWTSSSVKDALADVNWELALLKIDGFNSIGELTFHIHYFILAVSEVLEGHALSAHDSLSFDLPQFTGNTEWYNFLAKIWSDAENLSALIERLPEAKLNETFVDNKYGSYYRNLTGIVEHTHYHLGQIIIMKKMIKSQNIEH